MCVILVSQQKFTKNDSQIILINLHLCLSGLANYLCVLVSEKIITYIMTKPMLIIVLIFLDLPYILCVLLEYIVTFYAFNIYRVI